MAARFCGFDQRIAMSDTSFNPRDVFPDSAHRHAREGFDYQQNCRGIAAGIVIAEMKKGLAAINLLTLCVYGAAGRN